MLDLIYFAQIVYASFLGAILGWQRARWGKSAGSRTYALVTAGSALFTLLSINAFGLGSDVSRVASQIVVGIGFLGAGTILHKENRVEGLTTAAGLWIAAAIGMAVGTGYYTLAAATTALMLIILFLDRSKTEEK
ncbi:MAG: MgtC/SapB family protein [Patescibacteria group bacterium]|nr:MgtC/SapB family protein [Patescibacteria group bacterium]